MSFSRTAPTDTYRSDQIASQEYVDLGAVGLAKKVVNYGSGGALALGLSIPVYDYVARVLTNSTTETYTFKSGGSGGTTVATVVIVYTDSTLNTISTVSKT